MAVTMAQVLDELRREEPNYARAVELGEEAVPHLRSLVRDADPLTAAKATYLASLIQSPDAVDVVEMAANSDNEQVRMAAAAGIRNLAVLNAPLINELLESADVGLRKVVLLSVQQQSQSVGDVPGLSDVLSTVRNVADNDESDDLRQLAAEILAG